MSKRRTINIVLTENQYRALAGAVARTEEDWSEIASDVAGTPEVRDWNGSLLALNNAWKKINEAWHAKAGR